MSAPHVLIALDDTSGGETTDRAIALHRHLRNRGVEVRTVALAPGGDGALDVEVPVLGPSSRSLASALQLRREAKWADLVVCMADRSERAMRGARGRNAIRLTLDAPDGADASESSQTRSGAPAGRSTMFGGPSQVTVVGLDSHGVAQRVIDRLPPVA